MAIDSSHTPPEIVQLVKMPTYGGDPKKAIELHGIALCMNFTTPHETLLVNNSKVTKSARKFAEECVESISNRTRAGTISDLPALTLALRGIPFTNTNGIDHVAQISDIYANIIDQDSNTLIRDYSINISHENKTPFTSEEIGLVIYGSEHNVSWKALTPSRVIPIDFGTGYGLIAADVFIHPSRYLPVDPKTGKDMSIADTVKLARTKHTKADDYQVAIRCMLRAPSESFSTCRAAAARNTLEIMSEPGAPRYNFGRYRKAADHQR